MFELLVNLVIGAVVTSFLVLVALLAIAAVMVQRKARRVIERRGPQARRLGRAATSTTGIAALTARAVLKGGPAGEAAQLRLKLQRSLDRTRRVLDAAAPTDRQLGESVTLIRQLEGFARTVDADLRRLEREPDVTRVVATLPQARERVERIVHACDSLRWAIQDRLLQLADDDMAELTRQVETEAVVLRAVAAEQRQARSPRQLAPRTSPAFQVDDRGL
jgi:hypothetical protein